MSRLGRWLISRDDTTSPAVASSVEVLSTAQGGTGSSSSSSDGTAIVRSGTWRWIREWYDVKEFGATGDGVTDDTAALDAALTAGAGTIPVYLPPGTYVKTTPLSIVSNAIILGAGRRLTIIKNTTTDGLQKSGSAVTDVTLRGFAIETTNDGTNTKTGFDLTGFSYSQFDDLLARFHETGFKLSRGSGPVSAYFNKFGTIWALRTKTGLLLQDVSGNTPNANAFERVFVEDVGVWSAGNGIDLSGYGNTFASVYVGLPSGNSAIKIRNVAGTNQCSSLYAESNITYAIDNSVGTSGRRNFVGNIHIDSATMVPLATVGDADLIVFNVEATVDTAANPKYLGAFNTLNIKRAEAILTLQSVAASSKTWKLISGGGAEVGAGQFGIQNTTDGRNVVRLANTTVADAILADGDGVSIKSAKVDVVATASLPAAGATQDGRIIIEDNGAGDRNLIIYAGGQRFRVDGGAAF